MKHFFLILTFCACNVSIAQRFSSNTFFTEEKIERTTGDTISEINMFTFSRKTNRLIHTFIKGDKEDQTRFFKLISMKEEEDANYDYKMRVKFKSKLHDYELFITIKGDSIMIIGDTHNYDCRVLPSWSY